MNLLVLTGSLYPIVSNNSNLIFKLLPALAKNHEVHILSTSMFDHVHDLPTAIQGFPVHWINKSSASSMKRLLLYPTISKLADPNGNSDVMNLLYIYEELKEIKKEYRYDSLLSTSEPFSASAAAALDRNVKRVLYLMDPPELVRNDGGTFFRNKYLGRILKSQNAIVTTPFIKDALLSHRLVNSQNSIVPVGFPLIMNHLYQHYSRKPGIIRCLFTGWMCSDIRSPRYFLDIVSRLDERFEVTFMGRECERLQERFPVETNATLVTLPNQPYEVALQAMADADVLINIGNSVPVHMPSKTLEYINTGKPMVNFYKFDDCPTLYYTKRYPLALNIFEGADLDSSAVQFTRFCENNIGKTVDREFIEAEYADCTPNYIAERICRLLSNESGFDKI